MRIRVTQLFLFTKEIEVGFKARIGSATPANLLIASRTSNPACFQNFVYTILTFICESVEVVALGWGVG